jgi:hypothetical protein
LKKGEKSGISSIQMDEQTGQRMKYKERDEDD